MADTPKIDLHGTTWLRRGVSDRRWNRAIRTGICNNVSISQTGIDEALAAFMAMPAVLSHPSIPDMPLQHAAGRKWGPTVVRFIAEYGYGNNPVPSTNPRAFVKFRLYSEAINVWRSFVSGTGTTSLVDAFGLPAGDPLWSPAMATDGTKRPPNAIYRRPMLRMIMSTTLSSLPYPQFGFKVSTVNSDTVGFGGFDFPPGWILFEGADTDVLEDVSSGSTKFPTTYLFTIARGGHWYQEPWFDAGTWKTRPAIPYLASAFNGAFPVA